MSVCVTVFLRSERLPSPTTWQATARDLGLALDFDPSFDPEAFSGWLPVAYRSEAAGFEYGKGVPDAEHLAKEVQLKLGPVDAQVELRTHGDARDSVVAALAASCLAIASGGVLYDESSGEVFEGRAALDWARRVEREYLSEASRERAAGKTPAAWRGQLEACLRDLNPAYARNKLRGVPDSSGFELVREDTSGLVISQNVVHRGGSYELGFALLFSRQFAELPLATPLLNGGRLDGFTARDAFHRDLGEPAPLGGGPKPSGPLPHATYGFRKNTFDLVRRDVELAETRLLPHYRRAIRAAARDYQVLFEQAQWLLETLKVPTHPAPEGAVLVQRAAELGVKEATLLKARDWELKGAAFARQLPRVSLTPRREWLRGVALSRLQEFVPLQDELPAMRDIVCALR